METEFLHGGLCDGLEIKKTDADVMYAGIFGGGQINAYQRREDGKLHFWYSIKKTTSSATATIDLNLEVGV